ncbi:MAG TPA: hypothetical protein ENJ08_01050 [Gammaproteobacteria bacterium]|nr:hypothetical protein [Gammaproteobacteria bacterium]
MDRRAFFTRGAGKAAQAITKHAADQARKNATRWIRPPFAIEELDFLLACDRCADCIDACPHDVIFPLSSKLGVKVYATPAMDLLNQGCHLCEDWPCVQACTRGALTRPDSHQGEQDKEANKETGEKTGPRKLPVLAVVSINKETCLPYSGPECGACNICPVQGAMSWEMQKPVINTLLCTGCALCREACIVEPKAISVKSVNSD